MQFKKLRLSGFKSFVRPTELLIEPGLTGIVGPNGCGKSNVVEALRWAMGESSARGLRGGEMDDVIFAGTAGRPAYDLAEVSLQLHADGARVTGFEDDDELELVRRIGRGAGSSFRLNGRELRARDVQLLFADAASGARSAAVVSQGQIGALVEAKPQDRRRLLEDAAGVAGLQARRHEAELKLKAAEANLVRLEDLLHSLGEQNEQLRKQARQAKRYGELGTKLREVEARLAVGRWLRAAAEREDARERLVLAGGEASAAAGDLDRLREQRAAASALLAARREEAARVRTEQARLAERVRADEQAREERLARLARAREQVAQLERDRADADRLLHDAEAAVTRLHEEQVELGPLVRDLDARRGAAVREVDRLSAATEQATREHRAALAAHGAVEARHGQADLERTRLEEERQALEIRVRELAATAVPDQVLAADGPPQVARAEAALAEAEAEATDAEVALERLEQAREAARETLRVAAERLRNADQSRRDAEQAVIRDRQLRDALDGRRIELAQRLERLSGRHVELDARRSERLEALDVLGLERLERACAVAEREHAAATGAQAAAGEALEAATAAWGAARLAPRELRGEIERLEVEAAALAELGSGADHPPVLERIDAPEHLTGAVAAALGDDLLASLEEAAPIRWGAPVTVTGTALPAAVPSLADLVSAPDALMPRLRQVGLCPRAQGAELQFGLAAGQRLVSAEGDLWRWDGFTRSADALQSVAARLRQNKRRRDLDALLTGLRTRLAEADGVERAARARVQEAEAELAAAAETSAGCAARRQAADRLLAEARSTERSIGIELAGLVEGITGIAEETSEVRTALADAQAELDQRAMPEGHGGPALQLEHEAAEAAHAEALAADQTAAERLGQARASLAERRASLEQRRRALDDARRAAHVAEAEAVERRHAAERQATELARLEAEREALAARRAELDQRLRELEGQRTEAGRLLAEAEGALERLEGAQAAAVAERFALDGRHQVAEQQQARVERDLQLWRSRGADAEGRVAELAARDLAAQDELARLHAALEPDEAQADPLRRELDALDRRAGEAEAAVREAEMALGLLEQRLEAAESGRSSARERVVRLEAEVERLEGLLAEAETALRARPLPQDLEVDEEVPEPAALAALDEERARLELARERLGAVNLRAVEELRELELRLGTLTAERVELGEAIDRLRRAISALNREGRERLRTAFAEIEKHFEALFARLFGGGQARLSLTDLEDPLAAGLELAASPPGKKLQSLSLLSGGEKALTALALIFAVFLSRPAPLCILDEVDAPLDDANVERLAALLDELAAGTRTRFIVVTHHPLTMAHMDRLYGVTMLERGVSELVSVDLGRAVELRQTA